MTVLFEGVKGIQSVELCGRILSAMVEGARPMSLSELASAAKMSASKARRYLISLCRIGLVEQDPESSKYDLGWSSVRLGLSALSRRDIVRQNRFLLRRLRDELGETVGLVMWMSDGPTVVHFEEADRGLLRVSGQIGTPLPLLSTAVGLTFAAFLPPETTKPLIDRERLGRSPHPFAPSRPMPVEEVKRRLETVRRHGLARLSGEPVGVLSAMAAPVFGHDGQMAAAIVVLGYKNSLDISWKGAIATALKSAANSMSRALGNQRFGAVA
jgi:DNA-binding IclR family transcriptional regulator